MLELDTRKWIFQSISENYDENCNIWYSREKEREKGYFSSLSYISEQFYKQYCIGNLEIGIYFSIELGVRMWTAMADSFPFLHSIPSLSTSTSHSCLSPPHFLIMNHFNPAQQKIPASRISKSRECVDETRWLIGTTR